MSKVFSITTFLFLLAGGGASAAFADVKVVASSNAGAEISADRYRVKLRFTPDAQMTVWSVLKEGQAEEVGSFPLEGFVRSRGSAPRGRAIALPFLRATMETKNDALVYTLLYGSRGGDHHHVVLQFNPTFFSYSLS